MSNQGKAPLAAEELRDWLEGWIEHQQELVALARRAAGFAGDPKYTTIDGERVELVSDDDIEEI